MDMDDEKKKKKQPNNSHQLYTVGVLPVAAGGKRAGAGTAAGARGGRPADAERGDATKGRERACGVGEALTSPSRPTPSSGNCARARSRTTSGDIPPSIAAECCASTFPGARADVFGREKAPAEAGAFSTIERCSARERESAARLVARGFGLRAFRALSAGLRAVIFGELTRRKGGEGR